MNRPTMTRWVPNSLRAGVTVALALTLLAPFDAASQQQRTVARLKSVTGNVLVSREAGLAAGSQAERLAEGTRIITTANSEAVIEFDNGCEVHLKENERFDVDSSRPCALLAGAPLGVPAAAVAPALAGYILPIVGAGVLIDSGTQQTTPVSPN